MLDLGTIDRPFAERLRQELGEVAVIFERQLASELSAINTLCMHIERYRGKMLRPTLVLLSGMVVQRDTLETEDQTPSLKSHRILAAVAEMIHMATLVHDDVLDEADVRRKGATINHLWGNEAAVMLGDYLISNAFHLCSTIGDPAINLALGDVTNTLCEGELLQLHHRSDFGLEEATYFEIIERKTASLIGASCQLGARLSGADDATETALGEVGRKLGVAFQIQDDLLDLIGDQSIVGKSLGRDLEKGKMTLPIIKFLAAASATDRGAMLDLLERRDAVAVRDRLLESGAVDASQRTAHRFVDDARQQLSALPEGPARQLFDDLARAVVERAS